MLYNMRRNAIINFACCIFKLLINKNHFMNIYLLAIFMAMNLQSSDCVKVKASVYHAVKEQCNNDPLHTAFMHKINEKNPYSHRYIAISRDLLKRFPKNTKVYISGTNGYDGIYSIADKMNKRKRSQIDILINKGMKIGFWKNVVMYKIKKK